MRQFLHLAALFGGGFLALQEVSDHLALSLDRDRAPAGEAVALGAQDVGDLLSYLETRT